MKVSRCILILTSENPERLYSFYRETIGLPEAVGSGPGAGQPGGAVQAAGVTIIIEGHSETAGDAKEPQRHLMDLHVDDLVTEEQRLLDLGVQFVRLGELEEWGGTIATFLDPDGNYLQLIEEPRE